MVGAAASLVVFWHAGDLVAPVHLEADLRAWLLLLIAICAGAIISYINRIRASTKTIRAELNVVGQALQYHQRLIDALPTLIWATDQDGAIIFLNRRWLDYTGVKREDAAEGGWLGAVHPDDRGRLLAYQRSFLAADLPAETEARMRRADGEYRWFLFRGEPFRDPSGIVQWFGSSTDIHDSKAAQETLQRETLQRTALRERERALRGVAGTVPARMDLVVGVSLPNDTNSGIQRVGISFHKLQEADGAQAGAVLEGYVHSDEKALAAAAPELPYATGEPFIGRDRTDGVEGELGGVDGWIHPRRDDASKVGRSNGLMNGVKAQENLRAAQRKLSRASQFASLAELSALIAHEVKQPLAAVVSNSQACQRWLSSETLDIGRLRSILDRIVRDANAAAATVTSVRALYVNAATARASIDVNDVIEEARLLLADDLSRTGTMVRTELDRHVPQVSADRIQIQQVLVNLLRNAMEAVVANAAGSRMIVVRSMGRDGEVRVEICDNGSGIEEPDRIFEPLFTTKARGMGLGLAVSRSIIEAHGGTIAVEAATLRGTVFSFGLPIPASAA
ncbi:sensor histidine kinase [Methylobacterium nonmethylotrophicum]|uniref:sensor histidine kinase n=1 Tax=Methylobacterium nonmethylotrophicum TaxID=1141884 RepID=UPI001436C3C0|nr:PAS domain-containing sensor histidine kinase [Methylobacterium nonmethylotrophicum]